MPKKSVLLLSTQDNAPDYVDRNSVLLKIAEAISSDDVSVDKARIEDLDFSIINGITKVEIIDSERVIKATEIKDLADYDLVYIKNWKALADIVSAIALYLNANEVRILCEELNHFRFVDKTSESFGLALNGIPYPDTLFCAHTKDLPKLWQRHATEFPFPVVVKAADGSAGSDNFLVHKEEDLQEIAKERQDVSFMIQNFIPNDSDNRIIMLGYEPALAFRRKRQNDSTHLNNTSQGALAELVKIDSFSPEVLADCRKAAQLVRREIAGVDVMFNSETGQHVILEVNASPQLATGAFLKEKREIMHQYFNQILNIDANDKK